ncbi:hypothetical protein QA649_08960 [Bradyrhizobium sp. CB1717]|uniref:hypothetical protein n=1 Tax=Bradyrhizobium sp. CB1717 TaxID=3039154 RepID=UPI0024B17C0A|nr:hypothetical protein [Bradyrhizobium sp. CB1717]WFU26320.1 hypothetical protein QA649_08960 [Bradyrhizobium sp. CB1717]
MIRLTPQDVADASAGQLPSFVKTGGIIRYWVPDRTAFFELDYLAGREHFREAVRYSLDAGSPFFLAHVLMGMFGDLGDVERGFLDTLLLAAKVGAIPPRLTDEELISAGLPESEWDRARTLEAEVASALALRAWFMPDQLLLLLYGMLSGVDGEHIGAAITMIARTAVNGTRN